MQIWPQKIKYGFKRSVCIGLALFLFVVIGAGCAGTRKTTTTKTTVTSSTEDGNKGYLKNTATDVTSNEQQNKPVTKESETTTTTTTETKAGHPGILSSTLHAIGWVIALPFRLVGGLIQWIF